VIVKTRDVAMKIEFLRRPVICCFSVMAVLLALDLAAQTRDSKPVPQPRVTVTPTVMTPPRDRPPDPQSGTGTVRGRVIDAVTGRPIARARVKLNIRSTTQGPVLTDANGGFVFTGLPAGPLNFAVERNGYLNTVFPEARSIRARGRILAVGNGETRDDVSIAMFRGASISGRVTDAYGEPVDGAVVMVSTTRGRGSRGQVQTNDLGEFRIARLSAGRYILNARAQSGYQNDPGDQPLPQSLPTYYPGTLSRDKAQVIGVNRGQAIAGLELTLVEGVPSIINGLVVTTNGQPISGGNVMARAAREFGVAEGGGMVRPDGSFRIQLPPGEFYIEARAWQGPSNQPIRSEDQLVGTTRIAVAGGGREAVAILVGKGATASGRIVFEGTAPPPTSPGVVRVPIYNNEGQSCQGGQATVAADWTFKAEGLSGTCSAAARPSFGTWTVKSVMFRGQNLLDESFTFEPGQHYGDVQILMTDRRSEILLRVSGDDGQITREFVAIAFSADRKRWPLYQRYIQTFSPTPQVPPAAFRPDSPPVGPAGLPAIAPSGRIVGLPPGEYYVIAVDDIEYEDSLDPFVLEKLAVAATRIVLPDEAVVEANLRRHALADVVR
jgi:hypothetical protein